MKEYKSGGERKLWYEDSEIDQIMVDELHKAGLLPNPDSEDVTIDLERLVERHLRFPFDQHAVLATDVLGVTHFAPGKPPRIEINRDLTGAFDADDATTGIKGRWRATVAHEVGHGLLHRILYELDDMQRGLFAASPRGQAGAASQLMRCLKRDAGYTGGRDWREVQANKAIGSLLMPRPVLLKVVKQERDRTGLPPLLEPDSVEFNDLVAAVARRFTVSRQAARIRLGSLGCVSPQGQVQL